MDQQTQNKLAVIDRYILGATLVGSILGLILLAAFRDGIYGTLLTQALPGVILGTLAAITGVSLGGGIVQAFQTKYTSQANAATTISQNQTQAQTTIAQVQAGANNNGTPPLPAPGPQAPQ